MGANSYLKNHAAELSSEQKLLALADQRINDKVLFHICCANVSIDLLANQIVKHIPLLPVNMQSTPNREFFSLTWRDLIAASVSIGLRPEFSANAKGTASSASAKARIAYCSMPGLWNPKSQLLY